MTDVQSMLVLHLPISILLAPPYFKPVSNLNPVGPSTQVQWNKFPKAILGTVLYLGPNTCIFGQLDPLGKRPHAGLLVVAETVMASDCLRGQDPKNRTPTLDSNTPMVYIMAP